MKPDLRLPLTLFSKYSKLDFLEYMILYPGIYRFSYQKICLVIYPLDPFGSLT